MAFRDLKPEEWLMEIDKGLDYRRKFGLEQVWAEIEAMYYNVHPSMANDGPNILLSVGDSLLSTLGGGRSQVLVNPERPEAVKTAPLVETLDNILLREMDVDEAVNTASLHAFLFGTGIVKLGYDSEYGYDPKFDIAGVLQLGLTLTQYDQMGKRRLEHDDNIFPGMPWAKAVSPHDIIVPWGTINLATAPWIAHRFVRHIDDLRADRKYSNTQRLEPTLSMEDFVESYRSQVKVNPTGVSHAGRGERGRGKPSRHYSFSGARDTDYVELYEIHDRRTSRIKVVAAGHPSFLRSDINALQIEGRLPFVEISFTPRSRSFWTTSDAYYLRHLQIELSDLAVQRTKIRRLAVVKFLYDQEAISKEQFENFLNSDVGAGLPIEAGAEITKAVLPIQTHPDQTLIMEEEHLRKNSREQVGFSRNQLGEFSGGRKTATEAMIVDSSSARRLGRRGKAITKLYQKIIETVNGIIFNHWSTPRYIQVLGQEYGGEWVQVTGPQLKSRYSYQVIFSDEDELRQRRMEALQLYTLLTQDPSVDPVALRQYLSDSINDPAFGRLWNNQIQDAMRTMRIASGVQPEGGRLQLSSQRNQSTGLSPTGQNGQPSLGEMIGGRSI